MRKLMFKISKFAPAALAVAGVLVAGAARAERECERPASETGRVCEVAVCIAMQDQVNLLCKTPAPVGCYKVFGCAAREAMRQRWVDCRQSRIDIRAVCFPAGEPGHDQKILDATATIAKCDRAIQEPTTRGGCTDPCPKN